MIDKVTRGHVAARRVVALLGLRAGVHRPGRPAAAPGPVATWSTPESGLVVPAGRLTVLAAATPADAVRVTDRLGRYADSEATLADVPLRDLPLETVRERILVADNDARLFSGELRAELDPHGARPTTHGRGGAAPRPAPTDIVDGARRTAWTTPVAERGREFSGGQQQRLRLARALAADPEVLVLVEPTSAVDAHTEADIAARLAAARAGRTTLVCSTSPLLLDRADHVVFMSDGKVVAEGTHRELMAEPRYAAVVSREES